MGRFWRVFAIWAAVLSFVWVLINLPRNGGPMLSFLSWAGFPWTFASWKDNRLTSFYPLMLAADVVLGIVVTAAVALLCASQRCRGQLPRPESPTPPPSTTPPTA
jgi:hypothetical protein